ncbi:hypothetical protein Plhal304r1_c038g0114311 [Plasmopara halstedii]
MSKVYLLDKPKFRADTCVCLAFQCLVREPELTMFYEAALAHVELISMLVLILTLFLCLSYRMNSK